MKNKTKFPQYTFFALAAMTLVLWLLYDFQHEPKPEYQSTTIPLLLGSFTKRLPQSETKAEGIYFIEFDPESMSFSDLTLLTQAENPSYAAMTNRGRIYTVLRGGEQDTLNLFNWDRNARELSALSSVSVAGASPCYVALHPGSSHVVVANYRSGNASIYAIDPESGAPKINTRQVVSHEGSGPNLDRQASPHAHWAQWNAAGDRLYVVDLGIDKVMMYPFDKASGQLGKGEVAYTEAPGAGPRHMAFHPVMKAAYLLNELNSTLTFLRVEADGSLSKIETLSTLPEDYEGPNQTAHIAINKAGTALYASNRGHNSIVVVQLAEDGAMSLVQTISAGGDWPRHFTLLERYDAMIVANVRSNNLAVLKIESDGRLRKTTAGAFAPQPNFVASLKAP